MNHLGTKIIETKRLLLRPFTLEDAGAMYENWASDPEVTKFLTWPAHGSIEISQLILGDWVSRYGQPDFYQWSIVPKELGQPIGSISVVEANDRAELVHIGYCIGKRWWKMGYTSEALKALIRFFFEEVGVNRVEARHDPRNPHSGGVMRKCGMRYEGTLRQSDRNNQGICDASWYAILREEYEQARQPSEVIFVTDPRQKNHAAARILYQLPAWFGIPQSTAEYVRECRELPLWAVYDNGLAVGFAALKQTGDRTGEIFVMGVEPGFHRRGIGRKLIEALESWAVNQGFAYLQVKTVRMGRYEEYDRTNRFYQAMGFRELECFPTLWDPGNPCQIYVKYIGRDRVC